MATTTAPASAPSPKAPPADIVEKVTKIPGFMRKMHWYNAALLLDKWFSGPSAENPHFVAPDTSTVKMDQWVLTFARARAVYETMVREQVWINPKAQARISEMLAKRGLLGSPGCYTFGNLLRPASTLAEEQVNFRQVSDGYYAKLVDPLDDLYGALGAFEFLCNIEADIIPLSSPNGGRPRQSVEIRRVGFYVKDKFDFTDDQPLGFWNFETGEVDKTSRYPFSGFELVTNATLRSWRQRHGRGGDFKVYSDVKILELNPPQRFVIG